MKGIIELYDRHSGKIEELPITKLPYRQEKVIEKSIALFNDHDPCIMNYTYSVNQLAMELLAHFNSKYGLENKLTFMLENCPAEIMELVCFPEEVSFIKIR